MSEDRLSRLENQVNNLERVVRDLKGQLAGLEGSALASPDLAAESPTAPFGDAAIPSLRPNLSASGLMFVLGRSVLVLAGGFLLRVMTESGSVPPLVGFALGMLYSLGLVLLAHRMLGGDNYLGASSIGLTAAVVAYPFLTESIIKLHLVADVPGGLALVLITAAGLGVAWWHRQRFLAWVFCLAALAAVLVLGFRAGAPEFFALLLLLLGAVTTLLAYTRRWHLKRWIVAVAANAVFFRLTVIASNPAGVGSGGSEISMAKMLALDLALLVGYLGFFCYRALVQGRGVRVFDVVQSAFVLAVGFGGALRIANATGKGVAVLGWSALVAAVAFYAVAFTIVRSRLGRGRGFFYFASLALVFLFLGSQVVAQGPWLSWIWLVLGLLMAVFGSRFDRVTLRYHSVIYLVLASIQTGLLAAALDAFVGKATSPWHSLGSAGVVNVAVAFACYAVFALRKGRDTDTRARRVPAVFAAVLSLMGLGYLTIVLVTRIVTEAPPAADSAVIAVIRTAVLSLTAVALALFCRRSRLRELAWLVYPLLGLGGVKLLVEDLRQGSPATLFVAFGFFGVALILAPRLVSAGRKAREGEASDQ